MFELDDATRRALSQRYGPTPDAQARVLAELRSTLGGPAGTDGGGGEGAPPTGAPPTGTGQVVWIAKICAATAGLTGAGLLVLKLGATVLSAGGLDASEPASAPVKTEVPSPARVSPSASETPELQADIESTPPPLASPAAVPIQAPTKRRTASSSLAAELALLDAAKRIHSSDPEAALHRLEQHRKEFPTGALAPEREALRVEVLCALGRLRECGTASHKSGD